MHFRFFCILFKYFIFALIYVMKYLTTFMKRTGNWVNRFNWHSSVVHTYVYVYIHTYKSMTVWLSSLCNCMILGFQSHAQTLLWSASQLQADQCLLSIFGTQKMWNALFFYTDMPNIIVVICITISIFELIYAHTHTYTGMYNYIHTLA